MGLQRLLDAQGEADKYPSVTKLPWPVKVFDNSLMIKGMSERQYNNCLALIGGELLMSYRIHGYDRGRSEVAIAHLGPKPEFNILKTYVVRGLPAPRNTEHFEDARLFEHQGAVWMTYTEVRDYNERPWRCSQRLVRLEKVDGEYRCGKHYPIRYGKNDQAQEKNWQFFSHEGKLYFVYGIKPHRVCELDIEAGVVVAEHVSDGVQGWPYGSLSGGTPPVRIGDYYYSFLHSYVPHTYRCRRYNMSCYEFEARAPFKLTRVSQRPLAFGSAKDGYADDPRFNGWQPLVTFPSGLVFDGDFQVSVGINDHLSTIFSIPTGVVMGSLGDPKLPSRVGERVFKTTNFNCPVKVFGQGFYKPKYYSWTRVGDTHAGIMRATDPNLIRCLEDLPYVTEITGS